MSGATLRIDVLGPLRLRRGSEPVTLGSARQRRVLARLLVGGAHPVGADALIEAGWGDDLPQRPAGALHTVVSRIRSALAPEASIELTAAGYLLTGAEVDVQRFDHLVRLADLTTDRSVEAQVLDQALGLWRGRAYEGLDLLAAEPEAQRLDASLMDATERRADLLVSTGAAPAAVALLTPAVQTHPLREDAHAALMRALYHAGRAAEALDVYHEVRERLIRDLGLDPSPTLAELHRRILTNDLGPPPALRPSDGHVSDGAASRGVAAPSPSPFVGRQHDVAALRAAVGTNRLVSVVGVGGVGKTRLAVETLPTLAAESGLRFIVVACEQLADAVELRTAVVSAAQVAPSDPDHLDRLAWAFERVPTMLVLDGAEDVRLAASELIERLLAESDSLRVVTTTRLALGSPHEHLMPLAPLDIDADSGAHVQTLFDTAVRRARPDFELSDADRSDVIEICRLLDGLPLAIELAGARTAAVGLTGVRDDLSRGLRRIDSDTADRRRSLRGIVEWSYHCLDPGAASLLSKLAVPPGPLDVSLAASVAGCSPSSVSTHFDRLVTTSLLVPVDLSRRSPGYRMLELVRQYALTQLTDTDRRRTETDIVHWATDLVTDAIDGALGPDDRTVVDHVARHVANVAFAVRRASRAHQSDADELVGRLALVSPHRLPFSVAHLIHSVGGRGSESEPPPTPLAVAAAARAATLTGDVGTGLELAQRAWDAAAGDPDTAYLAAHTLSVAHLYHGDSPAATAWSEQVLAPQHAPAARIADAHATIALAATYEDDLATARHHADIAEAFAGAAGARAYRAFAAYVAGEVALRESDRPRADACLRRASRLAVDAGSSFIAGLSDTALASLLVRGHHARRSAGLLHRVLAHWNREGVWPQIWTSIRLIAELCADIGDDESTLLMLQAAHHDPRAPDVTGSDLVREAALVDQARSHLSTSAVRRVDELARRLGPTAIIDHALTVTDLSEQRLAGRRKNAESGVGDGARVSPTGPERLHHDSAL